MAKHARDLRLSVFGDLPVQAVDVGLLTKALEPIWRMKPETASRVRGRIDSVLHWATVRSYRKGNNPARWRGHLDKLFPARAKVRRTVPGTRMTTGRERRVPLSGRAFAIIEDMKAQPVNDHEFVFPGGRPRKPLSNMAMLKTVNVWTGAI